MTLPAVPPTAPTSGDGANRPTPIVPTASGWFSARRGWHFAVTLTGEVDPMLDPQLRSLERQFRRGGSESARVDLRSVTFFGSSGCRFLCELQQTAQERGGSVTLLGASPVCLRTLALVGLDTAFDSVA